MDRVGTVPGQHRSLCVSVLVTSQEKVRPICIVCCPLKMCLCFAECPQLVLMSILFFPSFPVWSPCSSSSFASTSPTSTNSTLDLVQPTHHHHHHRTTPTGSIKVPEQPDLQQDSYETCHLLNYPSETLEQQQQQQQAELIANYQQFQHQVPPPYSSTTYVDFAPHQQQLGGQAFSSSTLPRSMNTMAGRHPSEAGSSGSVPHVAEVYEPKQHPVHKYWTLPRSIAAGTTIIETDGGGIAVGLYPDDNNGGDQAQHDVVDNAVDNIVDRFHQQHTMNNTGGMGKETTRTTTLTSHQQKAFTTKQVLQQVPDESHLPTGAQKLYETNDVTFYTVPQPEESGDGQVEKEDKQQQQNVPNKTTITYAVPKSNAADGNVQDHRTVS